MRGKWWGTVAIRRSKMTIKEYCHHYCCRQQQSSLQHHSHTWRDKKRKSERTTYPFCLFVGDEQLNVSPTVMCLDFKDTREPSPTRSLATVTNDKPWYQDVKEPNHKVKWSRESSQERWKTARLEKAQPSVFLGDLKHKKGSLHNY